MDILYVLLGVFLCIFNIGFLNATLPTPIVTPKEPIMVNPGESVNLTCVIPGPNMFTLVKDLSTSWLHNDVTITKFNVIMGSTKDKYKISFDVSSEPEQIVIMQLSIHNVGKADAGTYTCRVHSTVTNASYTSATTITPREKITGMEFELDGDVLTLAKQQSEPAFMELRAESVTPTCITRGSFPGAKIELYKGKVKLQGQVSQKAADNEVIFKASPIQLTPADNNVTLKCVAMVPGLPDSTVERSWRLGIITYEPEVSCVNTSAMIGYKYHEITCMVALAGITCSKLIWEDSSTLQKYNTNDKWSKYETKCSNVNSTVVETKMVIKQMTNSEFKTTWSLVYKQDHGIYKKYPNTVEQRYSAASPIYSGASILVFIVTMVIQSLL